MMVVSTLSRPHQSALVSIKVEFMAELLNWIALEFIGVSNSVATECIGS